MVEWDGLENRCTGNSTQGSNPCLSAKILDLEIQLQFLSCFLFSNNVYQIVWNKSVKCVPRQLFWIFSDNVTMRIIAICKHGY